MNKGIKLKAKLLKTSVELFEEYGYSNTTTRKIAEVAGVGRGHLSYYFPKKEDIVRELMKVFFKKIETFNYDEISVDCKNPYVYFAFLLRCFEYFNDTSDYFKMMVIDGRKMEDVFKFSCESYLELIEQKLICNEIIYDKEELQRSIEFSLLIFNHITLKKVTDSSNSNIEASSYAVRHFLLELNENEEVIKIVIEEAKRSFDKINLKEFYEYIHATNYEEILESK